MDDYDVVLFHSAAHVIRGEKVLGQAGVRVKMIPTPRQISTDCGMAIRFAGEDRERVLAVLAENKVPFKGVHSL